MKELASIKYVVEKDEKIRIVELIGFKGVAEIAGRYGNTVNACYGFPLMVKLRSGFVKVSPGDGSEFTLYPGLILTKEEFSQVILTVKACGANLSRLIREHGRNQKIKEVFI